MGGPQRKPEPVLFAHRGGMAHAPENTLEAFALAPALGATGLESDVWVSSDGVPVLHHDARLGPFYRRRLISRVAHDELPTYVPTLDSLYRTVGTHFHVSLDIGMPEEIAEVVAVTNEYPGAPGRLWLCHKDWEIVASWRELDTRIHLVDSTRLKYISEGPERRAARLAAEGVDAINLHESDWTSGLTTLFHRFGIKCLGWDAQHERQIDRLLNIGIDGLYSDHVDRMVARLQVYRDT